MKDALGHGSNALGTALKERLAEQARMFGAQTPVVSTAPKSNPVPVHPAMAPVIRAPEVRANDYRSNGQEANRSLVASIRNRGLQ